MLLKVTIHPWIISIHKVSPIILEIVVTSIVAVAIVAVAMTLAVVKVIMVAAEAATIMQIFSAKFASNLVTQ